MPDSLYGARLQGIMVVVFIVAKSRAWFDGYNYHDSLQARAIEGIGHWLYVYTHRKSDTNNAFLYQLTHAVHLSRRIILDL